MSAAARQASGLAQLEAVLAAGGPRLARGLSRASLAGAVLNSPEGRHVRVGHLYQQFLHRAADPGGA